MTTGTLEASELIRENPRRATEVNEREGIGVITLKK
jgi:hypothetical protein